MLGRYYFTRFKVKMDENFPTDTYKCSIDFKNNIIRVWEKIVEYENISLFYIIRRAAHAILNLYVFGMLFYILIIVIIWKYYETRLKSIDNDD